MATFYIDPSLPTNGVGSEASPFNVWPSLASNNTYLQKRGTTANANVTAFGRSALVIGAYGTGSAPVINGGSGIAFSASNTSGVTVSDIDFLSTGNHAFSWNGGNTLSISRSTIVGQRTGLNIISNASSVSGVTLTDVTARHTVVVNEQSGLFLAAQNGNAISNVMLRRCTFSGSASYGVQIKAGDSNSVAPISNLDVLDCDISNNAGIGLAISTGMTALSESKVVTNARVLRNTANNNGGPGMTLCIRGGNSAVAYNTVNGNNWAGLTGTGGLQLTGAYGVRAYGNVCNYNRTTLGFDGVGLYLDVCTGALNDIGCEYCTVFGNYCEGNDDFLPDAAVSQGNPPSSGIAVYHSHNNTICGNVCVRNGVGILVNSWSINNKIYNNTLVGNKFGVGMIWQHASHNNVVQNNVIVGSTSHALLTADAGTRATTGNITLSGTTGLITCTSSANDFTTFSTGYAVVAGSGYGFVVSKTSATVVTLYVLSPFSGTSFSHGAWNLSGGQDQGQWSNRNAFFGNSQNVFAGSGQSIVIGAQSLTSDPLLTPDYRLMSDSPCRGAGVYIPGVRHMGGKKLKSVPDIGAYRYAAARTVSNTRPVG